MDPLIISRVLLSLIFIRAGFQAARDPGGRVAKAARLKIPRPDLAVRVNGAAMVVAGSALALGVLPEIAAGVLIACLIPTTLAGHAFWAEAEGAPRDAQVIQFLKNTGLIGGLLLWILAT